MESIIPGSHITKEKRQEIFGRASGGASTTNHENYSRSKIKEHTGTECPKTNIRINLRTHTLKDIACPNKYDDGFDYSEDFDGVQVFGDRKVYINLKCVVGQGGSQTRSLREVYWFIEGQLRTEEKDVFFANILDGDEAHSCMSKFQHLLSLPEFESSRKKVYVGDLRGYFDWVKSI
jgi:hypothetical protein